MAGVGLKRGNPGAGRSGKVVIVVAGSGSGCIDVLAVPKAPYDYLRAKITNASEYLRRCWDANTGPQTRRETITGEEAMGLRNHCDIDTSGLCRLIARTWPTSRTDKDGTRAKSRNPSDALPWLIMVG